MKFAVTMLFSLLVVLAANLQSKASALPETGSAPDDSTFALIGYSSDAVPLSVAKALLPGFTIRRTAPEVHFQFSVTDDRGRPFKSLSSQDVQVLDNRISVPVIRNFSRLQDLPLEIGILLDVSDSMQKTLPAERRAVQFLLTHLMQPQTDRVFLAAFSSDVQLWQGYTNNRNALEQTLPGIEPKGHITYFYDSLLKTCLQQFPPVQARDTAQRILVLVSDGEDTGSLHSQSEVIAAAHHREIQIYALSVHSSRLSPAGDKALKRLADATGGQSYVITSYRDLAEIFSNMEQQMRTQYELSFPPAEQSAGFHTVQISVAPGPKLHVHARQGYFFDAP